MEVSPSWIITAYVGCVVFDGADFFLADGPAEPAAFGASDIFAVTSAIQQQKLSTHLQITKPSLTEGVVCSPNNTTLLFDFAKIRDNN